MQRVRRPIVCILLVWYLAACYTTPIEPKTAVQGRKTIQVTVAADADTLVWHVSSPWIRNDTLGGVAAACQQGCQSPSAQWPVPMSEVVEVSDLHDISGKVSLTVLLLGVLAGTVALMAAMRNVGI